MLRGEQYLVKYGTIDISHNTLPRIWNLEKVCAVENISLMKIPESHNSKLGDTVFPLVSAASLAESFSLYVSIALILNAMQFIDFCKEILLLVELLINSLFFLHKKGCRLFFEQQTLLFGTFIVLNWAIVTAFIFIVFFFFAWLICVGRDEVVPFILLWKANFFACVLIQGQNALNQLHCYALVAILRIWNALMVLTELEWELLLICLGLLVYGRLYKFLALYSVSLFLLPFSLLIFFGLLTNLFKGLRWVHLRAHLRCHIGCITSLYFIFLVDISLWQFALFLLLWLLFFVLVLWLFAYFHCCIICLEFLNIFLNFKVLLIFRNFLSAWEKVKLSYIVLHFLRVTSLRWNNWWQFRVWLYRFRPTIGFDIQLFYSLIVHVVCGN